MPKKSQAYALANAILLPLLRVLVAAGLKEQELLAICSHQARRIRKEFGRQRLKFFAYRGRPLDLIISRWCTDPTFQDVNGSPAELKFAGECGFIVLVRRAFPGIPAKEALRQLRRHRLVFVSRQKKIRLLSRFFPMRAANAIDIEFFKQHMIDFLRTHEVNFLRNPKRGEGLFQRIAERSSVDARMAPIFNRYARKQGETLLEAVDDWLARREGKVLPGKRTKRVRLGLGIYVINESIR